MATGIELAQEASKLPALPALNIPYIRNGSALKGMDCQGHRALAFKGNGGRL